MVNQPQLHPVGSFAERHPANSPHGDFSQQIPKATKTPATRFYPEKGGVLRTSCQNNQFIRKKAGFYGRTWGKVSRTDADCGLTDKRGLRFTDRRSSDFPDTCHLDFPDTRYLNFPYTPHLTKQPKSGITNSAQKNGVIYRQVGGSMSKILRRKWEQGIHIILRQSQYTADLTIGRTKIIVQFLGKVKFLWTCQVM